MICKWCNGTNEECGCGYGYCAHCDNGEVTNPPFGPYPIPDILTQNERDKIWEIADNDCHKVIENVSIVIAGKQILSDDELKQALDYWDNPYRDETIGEVTNRVAWLVNQKRLSAGENT